MTEVHCIVCGVEMLTAISETPEHDYYIREDGLIVFDCPNCGTVLDGDTLGLPDGTRDRLLENGQGQLIK